MRIFGGRRRTMVLVGLGKGPGKKRFLWESPSGDVSREDVQKFVEQVKELDKQNEQIIGQVMASVGRVIRK